MFEEKSDKSLASDIAIETLKELRSELRENQKLSEKSFESLKHVSALLSSSLPPMSDKTLCEVDDLLYATENKSMTNMSKSCSEDTKVKTDGCFTHYFVLYGNYISRSVIRDRILDNTYLQFIEHSPTEAFELKNGYQNLYVTVYNLLRSRHCETICVALKFLRAAFHRNRETFAKHLRKQDSLELIFISKLIKIPQVGNPDKKRIAGWISRQAAAILEKFDITLYGLPQETLKYWQHYNSQAEIVFDDNYLSLLMKTTKCNGKSGLTFHLDHLHTLLISTKGRDERLDLLKRILAIFLKLENYEDLNFIPAAESKDDETNKCFVGQTQNTDQGDFAIEKFLVYEDFMKSLEVMQIIYSTCLMCKDILKVQGIGDSAGYCNEMFTKPYKLHPIHTFMNEALLDRSKRGIIPWWIQKSMTKCPFLFLAKGKEHLMTDLIKMLKGEEVDEVTEEKLFFAINNYSY